MLAADRSPQPETGSQADQLTSHSDPRVVSADQSEEIGPWNAALAQLRAWHRDWAETCEKMTAKPWIGGVLPRSFIELVGVALNAACTNLSPEGTRRHIRAALKAGATREEILFVLKCAAAMAIHSCSLGAPILHEEAKAAGVQPTPKGAAPRPACDKMKAMGQWNQVWDPFVELDPVWTGEFMAMGAGIYGSGVMPPRRSSFSASPLMPLTPTCTRLARVVTSKERSRPVRPWRRSWKC
jgi:alkylhydroperoxidase/carboxymuconolactone decarboxylase family protein YurZ